MSWSGVVVRRSGDGSTAMHVACLVGNTGVLRWLVEAGGDLRLHDCDGKTPRDWAMRQSDSKRRRQVLAFIDWAREKALCDPASTAADSKHVIELPAGLRFTFVLFSFQLLSSFCHLNYVYFYYVSHWSLTDLKVKSEDVTLHVFCAYSAANERCLLWDRTVVSLLRVV